MDKIYGHGYSLSGGSMDRHSHWKPQKCLLRRVAVWITWHKVAYSTGVLDTSPCVHHSLPPRLVTHTSPLRHEAFPSPVHSPPPQHTHHLGSFLFLQMLSPLRSSTSCFCSFPWLLDICCFFSSHILSTHGLYNMRRKCNLIKPIPYSLLVFPVLTPWFCCTREF